nr:MAG: hypothetical protein [Canine parvovirus]
MARTVASRKRAQLAQKNAYYARNTHLKATAVNVIMRDWYKKRNDKVETTNELLTDTLHDQVATNTALRYQLANITNDRDFIEHIVREIFQSHPTIAWEFRNRLSYDDIPIEDPEATEEEDIQHLFGPSDSEDENDALERAMQREIDQDNGYF